MESGKKRRLSGKILAGAFTVPAVVSAVQQSTVSANVLTDTILPSMKNFFFPANYSVLQSLTKRVLPSILITLVVALGLVKLGSVKKKQEEGVSDFFVEKEYVEEGLEEQIKKLLDFLESSKEELGLEYTLFELDVEDFKEILATDNINNKELEEELKGKNKITFRFTTFQSDSDYFVIKTGEEREFYTKPFYKSKENVLKFFNSLFKKTMEQQNRTSRLNLKFENGKFILEILKENGEVKHTFSSLDEKKFNFYELEDNKQGPPRKVYDKAAYFEYTKLGDNKQGLSNFLSEKEKPTYESRPGYNFIVENLNELSSENGIKVEDSENSIVNFPEIEYVLTRQTLESICDVEDNNDLKNLTRNKEEIKLKIIGFSDGRFKFKILDDLSGKEFYTYYLKKDLSLDDLIDFLNWFFVTGFQQGKRGLLFFLVDVGSEHQDLYCASVLRVDDSIEQKDEQKNKKFYDMMDSDDDLN